MLDANDLKQIGDLLAENNKVLKAEIVPEVVEQVVEQVGEMMEQNFLPAVDVMIEEKLKPIRAVMVTKDYLDEKLGKVNGKISVLADALLQNGALTGAQRAAVREA